MDTEQILRAAERCGAAYQRGYERGRADNESRYYDESPLSGEWAGYSVRELLGDLFSESEHEWLSERGLTDQDSLAWSDIAEMYEYRTELEDHYEQGYRSAFHDDDVVLCAGCETLVHREESGVSFSDAPNGERDYFCSEYCIR